MNTEIVAGGGESSSNCHGIYPGLQNIHGGQSEDLICDVELLDLMEALGSKVAQEHFLSILEQVDIDSVVI